MPSGIYTRKPRWTASPKGRCKYDSIMLTAFKDDAFWAPGEDLGSREVALRLIQHGLLTQDQALSALSTISVYVKKCGFAWVGKGNATRYYKPKPEPEQPVLPEIQEEPHVTFGERVTAIEQRLGRIETMLKALCKGFQLELD